MYSLSIWVFFKKRYRRAEYIEMKLNALDRHFKSLVQNVSMYITK